MDDPEACVPHVPWSVAVTISLPYSLGWTINQLLWMLVLTSFTSYRATDRYKTDTPFVRRTALATFIVSGIVAVLNFYEQNWWASNPYKDLTTLQSLNWVDCLSIIPSGIVATLVQIFLARRSIGSIMNRRRRAFATFGFGTLIFATFVTSQAFAASNFLYFYGKIDALAPVWTFNKSLVIWLWLAAVTDITISVALFVNLRKNIAGFHEYTDNVLHRLSVLSLQTGAMTSAFAVVGAVLATVYPDWTLLAPIPTAFWLPLPSLYALSLMATLDSRDSVPVAAQLALSQPAGGKSRMGRAGVTSGISVSLSIDINTSDEHLPRSATPGLLSWQSAPIEPTRTVSRGGEKAATSSLELAAPYSESAGRLPGSPKKFLAPAVSHWLDAARSASRPRR